MPPKHGITVRVWFGPGIDSPPSVRRDHPRLGHSCLKELVCQPTEPAVAPVDTPRIRESEGLRFVVVANDVDAVELHLARIDGNVDDSPSRYWTTRR